MKIEIIYDELSKAKEIMKKLVSLVNRDFPLRTEILDAKSAVSDAYDMAKIEYDKWNAETKKLKKEGEK